MLDRVREYLRIHDYDDFKNANEFASGLLAAMEETLSGNWSTVRARQAINRTTKSIYEFYRLRDTTVFGEKSPDKLRLGGPDTKSIKFVSELDHFYFSKFGGNTDKQLKKFFVDQYLENGAALFGRESTEELEDFRKVAGEKFKNLTDRQTRAIISSSVARVRNWAHVGSLSQARINLARLVATLDNRTTELCRGLNGKLIKVDVAQTAIERLTKLEPGEFAKEMYESKIGKAISKEPVKTIEKFIEDDGKTISDKLLVTGRGIPPFHIECRTRMEALIAGVDED